MRGARMARRVQYTQGMTKTDAIKALTTIEVVERDLIIRRPSVHADTNLARAFARRFHPRAHIITSDGWVVVG